MHKFKSCILSMCSKISSQSGRIKHIIYGIFVFIDDLNRVKNMKLEQILKDNKAEGNEKHLPVIEIGKDHGKNEIDVVRVFVGKEVPHPNTIEHHIAWIELYGVKQDEQVIDLGRVEFAPAFTNPNVRFQVPVTEFKAFCALSYCNVHGLWQNCMEL